MKYLLFISLFLCVSCEEQPEETSIPGYESFSFPKDLEDEIIEIDLSYYGMMCECPQWATLANMKLYETRLNSEDSIDYDSLFIEIRPAHDSIQYPFDLEGWEEIDDPIFTFEGQFYKGKHHWRSEGGGIFNNRVFRFTSCTVQKSNLQ